MAKQDLSPFELKNILLDIAAKSSKELDIASYNAGRGNPNFFNTTIRDAFSYFHHFMALDARKDPDYKEIGFYPDHTGIAKRLITYLTDQRDESGAQYLINAISYMENVFNIEPDELISSLGTAILGDYYPTPPRIHPIVERITNAYLRKILYQGAEPKVKAQDTQLFATEGATMAMVYLFNSLKENFLINKGDSIAIGTPIFSPYLEIPALNDYQLHQVHVKADEELNWQISDKEIDKLKDPKIKAFFLVNPSNPPGVALNPSTIEKIVKIIREKRSDLIIITDTVYAPFVEEFKSLIYEVPENVIGVYSFSKYFGVTGWRLGVIMINNNNIFDKKISKLPENLKKKLDKRYKIDSQDPRHLTFMERMVMDSRDVALAHTGGISTPQQVMMALMALYDLMDTKHAYKKTLQRLLKKRVDLLQEALGLDLLSGVHYSHYYILVNIKKLALKHYDSKFAEKLEKKITITDFVTRLAETQATVCLPGDGFGAGGLLMRISLANLDTSAYGEIGGRVRKVLDDYHREL